ncbi:PREDICTED: sorting nexin-24-like [Branchiostoma belcheri]|uniref:Sorting nexin-24-like n=1 Tax=Branchiostoma belcheri TaxID=7741 RepID=A0A6P4YY66_BRABE|nr:PREDICTED: sorting nexin-24-like [Branchiostoma belcheri]
MIDVSIPQFKQIESGDEKAYTVFVIEVCAAGRRHTLEKRYSELHTLHRELKKTYLTPEFPPKRVRNWNPKVLEQRRRGLETYLQGLIHQDILPKILLDFLEINMATQLGYESVCFLSSSCDKRHPSIT